MILMEAKVTNTSLTTHIILYLCHLNHVNQHLLTMIKHLVFWKLKESAQGNDKMTNAQLIKEKLEALNGHIAGLMELEVGIDFVQDSASADVALYSVFETREALDAYQVHPAHVAVKGFIQGVACGRQVVDYAC